VCFCLIIILSNPKIKQEIHIFFRIVLAGITMKTNEFIRRATKADYDDSGRLEAGGVDYKL